jgi:hypothetical protein
VVHVPLSIYDEGPFVADPRDEEEVVPVPLVDHDGSLVAVSLEEDVIASVPLADHALWRRRGRPGGLAMGKQ